jgi:hypothetical protein|tara:strand:- start:18375 stop:19082 length:708 start_codon:yes stop_codon:yes gene_type:complete
MINYANTLFVKTSEGDYVPGEPITDEGMALVFKKHDGKTKLGLSTGADDSEVFAGFSISRAMPPGMLPFITEGTVSDQGKFVAGQKLDQSNFAIFLDGTAVDSSKVSVGSSAPANAGEVAVDGDTLYFNDADKGKAVKVQSTYEPTVAESRLIHGEGPIGGNPSAEMGIVGRVITATKLTISNFDVTVDWASAVHPSLGADGNLTVGGDGTVLTNWVVSEAPTSSSAFLVLESVI